MTRCMACLRELNANDMLYASEFMPSSSEDDEDDEGNPYNLHVPPEFTGGSFQYTFTFPRRVDCEFYRRS